MIVTLEHAKDLLRYQKVVQHRHTEAGSATTYGIFSAIPDDEEQSSVDLCFNEDCDPIDTVSFSYWHGHYESAENEDENIEKAFEVARALLPGEKCLIEHCDAAGRPRGGDRVEVGGLPQTVHPDTDFVRLRLSGPGYIVRTCRTPPSTPRRDRGIPPPRNRARFRARKR